MHAEFDEFPWPKLGDILFRSDDHPLSNAWLNWKGMAFATKNSAESDND